ncbi:AAA family ATPase [Alteromonas lipotrueae]|uniref:AAA family ATPase n=1 Tax=Alteromonas lipotrueae TaxID=2803814 RepID=UPI001C455A1B|nr:AAA family ATPase [Alteromonas lipotrueae]
MSGQSTVALAAHYASAIIGNGLNERQYKLLDTDVLAKLTGQNTSLNKPFSFNQIKTQLTDLADTNRSDVVSHNARLLCDVYQVPVSCSGIIEYVIAISVSSALRQLVDELFFNELADEVNMSLLQLFELDEETCFTYLNSLTNNGFIRAPTLTDTSDLVLADYQIRLLTRAKLVSTEAYLDNLLVKSPSPSFKLKDFAHLDIETVCCYLASASKQQMTGVNILIYGDAGTGKTELARALAQSLSRNLYETRTANDGHKQIQDRYDLIGHSRLRLQYLSSMQALLTSSATSMFLVDESESIFADSDEYYAKDTLHRLLESNPVPCIWITNHVQCLEPSFIRRFKLVLEVGAIEGKYIEPLAKQVFRGLRVRQDYIDKLLTTPNITPAHIGNAVHVAKTINLSGQAAQLVVSEVVHNTLNASSLLDSPLRYKPEMPFDVSLLNFKQGKAVIKQIETALSHQAPVRILLSGEPGTGKTAYAHYLAQQHDIELVSVRCSSVLSKYVGESESNIARIFYDAQQRGSALLLDEVDSLLVSRERVTEHHDVQLINELLTQIECFEHPVFAATNYAKLLDKAVLRRFDFKLEAQCLMPEQSITLFKRVLSLKQITQQERHTLFSLTRLTTGDFTIVARRLRFQTDGDFRQQALSLLVEENRHKQPNPPIGFISKPH